MINETINLVAKTDPEVAAAIMAEYERQTDGLELIASEEPSKSKRLYSSCPALRKRRLE